MAVWLQIKVCECELELQPRLYAGSACDVQAPLQLQYAACGAISVPLPLYINLYSPTHW